MKRSLPFCAVTLAITSLAVSFGLSSKSVVIGQTYGNAQAVKFSNRFGARKISRPYGTLLFT